MLGMVLMKNYRRSRICSSSTGSIACREARKDNGEMYKTRQMQAVTGDRGDATELDRLQREWFDNAPEELQYDVDDTQHHRFWPAYLNIYFLWVNIPASSWYFVSPLGRLMWIHLCIAL